MITNLTNDMIRLCGEIATARDSRMVLRSNLTQSTADLKDSVSRAQTDLRQARAESADRTRTELGGFVSGVKEAVAQVTQTVAEFREEVKGDLAGARRAWSGSGAAPVSFEAAPVPKDPAPAAKAKRRKH